MKGNMTKIGLTTNMLISHAEKNHSQTEVVSVDVKGNVEKSTWQKVGEKSRKIASALNKYVLQFRIDADVQLKLQYRRNQRIKLCLLRDLQCKQFHLEIV